MPLAPLGSSLLAEVAEFGGMPALSASLDAVGAAEAAFIRRGKIKMRATIGYKVVVVVGDDSTSNEVETVDVELIPQLGGEPVQQTLRRKTIKPNGNKRYVFSSVTPGGFEPGDAVTLKATARNAQGGAVGQPWSKVVEVEDDGDATIRSVGIQQLDATNFQLKVLVVGDSEQQAARVDVNIVDLVGNAAIPESVSIDNPGRSGGRAVYLDQTLTFEDPSSAVDEVYSVVAGIYDDNSTWLSGAEFEVVVQGLEVGGVFPGVCWDRIQNGSETGVDCGGNCTPCPTTSVFDSIDLLGELASAATSEAAALLGLVTVPGTVGYEVSPAGNIAWTAGTEDGTSLVVADGFSSVTINGGDFVFTDSSTITMNSVTYDDGTTISSIDAYDRNGGLVGQWEFDDVAGQDSSGLLNSASVVGGSIPSGVTLFRVNAYGDIIIGGMRLDDFND